MVVKEDKYIYIPLCHCSKPKCAVR